MKGLASVAQTCAVAGLLSGLAQASSCTALPGFAPGSLPAGFAPTQQCAAELAELEAECGAAAQLVSRLWVGSFPIFGRRGGTSRWVDANTPAHSGLSKDRVLERPASVLELEDEKQSDREHAKEPDDG